MCRSFATAIGCLVPVTALSLGLPAFAQNPKSYVTGKITTVSRDGVAITSSDADTRDQTLNVPAGPQTQVRLNIYAEPNRIIPGTFVEMRVLWNGEDRLRATAIRLPEGRPTMFGLFKG